MANLIFMLAIRICAVARHAIQYVTVGMLASYHKQRELWFLKKYFYHYWLPLFI